jgi:hypothetical protein
MRGVWVVEIPAADFKAGDFLVIHIVPGDEVPAGDGADTGGDGNEAGTGVAAAGTGDADLHLAAVGERGSQGVALDAVEKGFADVFRAEGGICELKAGGCRARGA